MERKKRLLVYMEKRGEEEKNTHEEASKKSPKLAKKKPHGYLAREFRRFSINVPCQTTPRTTAIIGSQGTAPITIFSTPTDRSARLPQPPTHDGGRVRGRTGGSAAGGAPGPNSSQRKRRPRARNSGASNFRLLPLCTREKICTSEWGGRRKKKEIGNTKTLIDEMRKKDGSGGQPTHFASSSEGSAKMGFGPPSQELHGKQQRDESVGLSWVEVVFLTTKLDALPRQNTRPETSSASSGPGVRFVIILFLH